MTILGLFGIGKIKLNNSSINLIRLISTIFYVVFTWIQIYAGKQLKQFYAQDVIVFKNQEIFQNGWYGLVRHTIYLSQICQDLFAATALTNIKNQLVNGSPKFLTLISRRMFKNLNCFLGSYLGKNLFHNFNLKNLITSIKSL